MPAISVRKAEKALPGAADAVIIDLKDAVAVPEKAHAQNAVGLLAAHRDKMTFVRINALSTPFCYPDLLMVAAAQI